ncbi:acidic endochitinase-like [Prosopis cineraria]|uniref:acidic endochitinase-like n=1 Tax=Prosopis cineraria TaxID=364024 RepID=UPI0024105EA0|nr:acidic endochitinase-like [Prosopis cineraria]
MASKKQVLILLLPLLTLSSIIKPSHANDRLTNANSGKVAVYWGQKSESGEGNLTTTCDSDLYNIVALAYLHVYGNSTTLVLSNHCPSGDCKALASEIQHCQNKGIQVFLSLEIDAIDDPNSLGSYLYDEFLSGESESGLLGPVALDGIDLANLDQSTESWVDLVKAINGSTQERKIYISGAPRCELTNFDSAIATGLVDYLFVYTMANTRRANI